MPVGKLNKRSLRSTFEWSKRSSVTDADEICDMAAVRDLCSDAVFQSVINQLKNTLKDFPHVECLRKDQMDCKKNMVNGKDVFAMLSTSFVKSLISQLFPRVMSPRNGKAGAVSTIMAVCLTLVAIMKDQKQNRCRSVFSISTFSLRTQTYFRLSTSDSWKYVCVRRLLDLSLRRV